MTLFVGPLAFFRPYKKKKKRPRGKEKRQYGRVSLQAARSIEGRGSLGQKRREGAVSCSSRFGIERVRLNSPPSPRLCLSHSPFFKDQVQLDRKLFLGFRQENLPSSVKNENRKTP